MAFAQGLLFAGGGNTTIGGTGYPGAVRAIDPTSGNVVWEHGLSSPVVPALAYDNGMVFAGVGSRLEVLDAASGGRLFSYLTGATIYGPPSISNGIVFIGSGDTNLWAFQAVPPTIPPPDPSCPSGWTCQDIGTPAPAGSESVAGGAWSVSAGGNGVGRDGRDGPGPVHEPACLGGPPGLGPARDAGTRLHGDADGHHGSPGERPGLPVLRGHAGRWNDGHRPVQERVRRRGQDRASGGRRLPVYLEIQRVGDTFTAASSADGSTYVAIPGSAATLALPTTSMVGIVAASGLNGTAGASTVDSVAVGPPGPAPLPPPPPSPCPTGWSCTDVGNPGMVGDQTLSNGTWTLKGAGTGVAGYSDQHHFVFQGLAGDATLSARITVQQNTGANAQVGLIFRGDASTSGAFFYGAYLTPGGGIQVAYRPAPGLRIVNLVSTSGAPPAYLEISRWQTTYTTFTSPDGVNWSPIIGSGVTSGPAGAIVGGLFASSGNGTALATDSLDSVALSASAAPPPTLCPTGWSCQDIGFPTPPGAQYVTGNAWTVQGGGGDIWGTSDSFRFLGQPLAADGTVSARVDSQVNTSGWAKAGVMLRATTDPGSAYYAAFLTPSNGIAVQWRSTTGGGSSQVVAARFCPGLAGGGPIGRHLHRVHLFRWRHLGRHPRLQRQPGPDRDDPGRHRRHVPQRQLARYRRLRHDRRRDVRAAAAGRVSERLELR